MERGIVEPNSALLAGRRQRTGEQGGPWAPPLGKTTMGRCEATVGEHMDEPWQCAAQHRDTWDSLEQAFLARVTRIAPARVPRRRHRLEEIEAEPRTDWT